MQKRDNVGIEVVHVLCNSSVASATCWHFFAYIEAYIFHLVFINYTLHLSDLLLLSPFLNNWFFSYFCCSVFSTTTTVKLSTISNMSSCVTLNPFRLEQCCCRCYDGTILRWYNALSPYAYQ